MFAVYLPAMVLAVLLGLTIVYGLVRFPSGGARNAEPSRVPVRSRNPRSSVYRH